MRWTESILQGATDAEAILSVCKIARQHLQRKYNDICFYEGSPYISLWTQLSRRFYASHWDVVYEELFMGTLGNCLHPPKLVWRCARISRYGPFDAFSSRQCDVLLPSEDPTIAKVCLLNSNSRISQNREHFLFWSCICELGRHSLFGDLIKTGTVWFQTGTLEQDLNLSQMAQLNQLHGAH